MKKKLLKLVNYTLILFLLALSGCEKDLYENTIKEPAKASGQINYVTIDDVPLIKPNVEKFKKNISSKTAKGKISDLDLDLEHIIQYTESNGFTSYSIPIKIDTLETKDYYFQNLNIITDGKEYGSFVVKYNPDNDLKTFDLSTFTGTTEYFDENLNLKKSIGFVNGIPNESHTVNTNLTNKNETPAPSIDDEDDFGGGGGIDADDSGGCSCNSTSLIQQFFEWVGKVLASINISIAEGSGDNKAYVMVVTPPNTGTPTYAGSTVETFSGGGSITFVPNEPQWTYPLSSQHLMATRIMQRIEATDPSVFSWLADVNNLEYVKTLYFYLHEENSITTRRFTTLAINYLIKNPNVSINQLRNWFMGTSEGQDGDYDAVYWEDPNLTFQKQNLPTFDSFKNACPSKYTNAETLCNNIGGDILKMYNDVIAEKKKLNTCAIRISKALNYSGVIIPKLPNNTNGSKNTITGADGKNYIINAKALNVWMKKTFGTNSSNYQHYTASQGGAKGEKFPNLVAGKKGIYSMISRNEIQNKWGTGHADLLENGECLLNCHFYDLDNQFVPVDYIDLWFLN